MSPELISTPSSFTPQKIIRNKKDLTAASKFVCTFQIHLRINHKKKIVPGPFYLVSIDTKIKDNSSPNNVHYTKQRCGDAFMVSSNPRPTS